MSASQQRSLELVKYVQFVDYNTNTQVKCTHGKLKRHVMKLLNLVLHQVTQYVVHVAMTSVEFLLILVMFLDGRKKAKKQLNEMYTAVVMHV